MSKENNIFLRGSYALIIISFICLILGRAYILLSLPAAILTIKRIKFGYYYLIIFSVLFFIVAASAFLRGDFGSGILALIQLTPTALIIKNKNTKKWFSV